MNSKDNYKLVIAYDFGTTFSGASYAFTHITTTPEIFDIQKWPQKGGDFYPKTHTLLVYKRSNPIVMIEWGHGAKKMMLKPQAAKENIILSNFKLNLDESLQRGIAENYRSNVDIIADYLKALHEYVLEELSKGFAKNYDPNHFRYCLTVPAMWSDLAKYSMRKAAVKAGLVRKEDSEDRLMLISEPEAAALYCERMCDQANLKKGDRILICDAGGGTVDLIVFEIINDGIQNTNRLKEVTKGIGESCGSIFLDKKFKDLLEERLGQQVRSLPAIVINSLMDQFVNNIKPEFDGLDDQYLTLPFSINLDEIDMEKDSGLDEGIMVLRADELKKKVFDPIVDRVISLLEKQYNSIPNKELSCIFLVGGFGSSNYLYHRVQEAFSTRVNQILCPPRAALAVVRGAVYFGLNPRTVTSRISRRTYGINAGLPFDESLDPPSSRVIRPDGSIRCTSRFLVFVRKGNLLPIDHCIRETMFVYYGTIGATDIVLYATDDRLEPRYVYESGVKQVAAISVPIPELPNVILGERISYTVRMYFGLTEIRMEADFGAGIVHKLRCNFDADDKYDDENQAIC
ncbi:uncharacterized protein BX663DRAFT_515501 [Cokeromyces recurvatus]|uniref:uncharacterized protein n=1 Tax=Cokeromyces recurvatus TaxID=90255 RepID=UPI00221F9514|nr:uncharacterized protein BX663DRAFT_515501 [Cokeromyces recurvatus]KAI7901283.1 hypothetical protein BX663DRAFT_515501 [Cokeromyces recurvatus]